ncbi:hypothetical protein NITLEN_30375 [Nitrospira lenta]|uniref:Uncharacterized protein n=1 Tax=Nitrospira lenta TaxID=1436998 RepID=A0A330L885_9BACT|nr:hypothetical protein NITLEN_30375 [Nitrospira lenta]
MIQSELLQRQFRLDGAVRDVQSAEPVIRGWVIHFLAPTNNRERTLAGGGLSNDCAAVSSGEVSAEIS